MSLSHQQQSIKHGSKVSGQAALMNHIPAEEQKAAAFMSCLCQHPQGEGHPPQPPPHLSQPVPVWAVRAPSCKGSLALLPKSLSWDLAAALSRPQGLVGLPIKSHFSFLQTDIGCAWGRTGTPVASLHGSAGHDMPVHFVLNIPCDTYISLELEPLMHPAVPARQLYSWVSPSLCTPKCPEADSEQPYVTVQLPFPIPKAGRWLAMKCSLHGAFPRRSLPQNAPSPAVPILAAWLHTPTF